MNGRVLMSATAMPIPARAALSTAQICAIAVEALERKGRAIMDTIHEIDKSDGQELYSRSIRGTVLEPIADALREVGEPVEYVYGSVRDALDLSPVAMHLAFCNCENGASMRCDEAALQLRAAVELERDGKLLTRSFEQGQQASH